MGLGWCCFALAILFLASCADLKRFLSEELTEPPINPSVVSPLPPVFPHPENWKNPDSHGGWVLQGGHTVCLECHQASTPRVEGAPACASCHQIYPHAEGWDSPSQHGKSVMGNGKTTCTTQCHGTDLKGGLSGVSCNRCHAVFPHITDWKDPLFHGASAKGGGKKLCTGCHGDDLLGGESGVSCLQCHAIYPHVVDWKEKERHGALVLQQGKGGCQTECHGTDLKGGLAAVSCSSCHSIFPHPTDWARPENHGMSAKGDGKSVCKSCHGDDLSGGGSGVSCFQCHALYPHETNWAVPTSHGETARGSGKTVCKGCHGDDLRGGASGVSCFQCHPLYPHGTDWGTQSGHGIYVQTNLSKVDLGSGQSRPDFAPCQGCHGANLKGGLSQTSCYRCHDEYPHSSLELPAGTDWASGGDGRKPNQHALNFVGKINSGKTDACQKCHGVNYDTVVGGFQCAACHTHSFGEITHRTVEGVSWKAGMGHGWYFTQSSGLYRNQARFYPSWEQSVMLGYPDWNDPYGESQATFTDAQVGYCRDCHGDYTMHFYGNRDEQGEPTTQVGADTVPYNRWGEGPPDDIRRGLEASETSCYDCHWAYPHGAFRLYERVARWVDGSSAHGYYRQRHPFFMVVHPRDFDPNLHSRVPRGDTWSPLGLSAAQATCTGGTAGTCHNTVRRPENRNPVHPTCASCH